MVRPFPSLLACAALAPQFACAATQWGGAASLASNHLLRGISRSSNDPAVSAELHAQSQDGWFAGLWASTSRVRASDSTSVDVAATLGLGTPLGGDWALRGSYSHYESPWQNPTGYYRYDEATLDLRWREALLFSVSYSPNTARYGVDYGTRRGDAFAYEATVQRTLRGNLRAWAGAGYYDLSDELGAGYWYGSIGVGFTQGPWQLDVSYVRTDNTARRLAGSAARRGPLAVLSFLF